MKKHKKLLVVIILLTSLLEIPFVAFAQDTSTVTTVVNMGIVLKLMSLAAIDFYATVFFIGLAIKFDWISGIPAYLSPLAKGDILMLFGVLYVIEHFIEKIPVTSIVWTWVHVAIKPIAALVFLLAVAFKAEFEISFFTILFAFFVILIISLIDAKIWTFLGLTPGLPIIVTIVEDIIIVLLVIKTITPTATIQNKPYTPPKLIIGYQSSHKCHANNTVVWYNRAMSI